MANFYNYPQVVMSLYDSPMESSGAMSLGTSAGVGSSFALTHSVTWYCTNLSSYGGGFKGSYVDGDFIFWASDWNGIVSYPATGGGYCDVLCPYGSPYNTICDVTKGGNYYFATEAYANWGLMSFTADSNGDMTMVDTYRIGTTSSNDHHIYADTTLPLIFVGAVQGIGVYCYNTSTGVIGHTDYDYSGSLSYARHPYSYISNGCKIVVVSRMFNGVAMWCLNTSTCMLGNACTYGHTGSWLSNGSTACGLWGGCATGCQLSSGGFFLVSNGSCGIGVLCTYDSSGPTLCLKTCARVATHFCSGDSIDQVTGDDDYIYATGGCSIVYRMTLNCSTGVLTVVDSYEFCTSTTPGWYPRIHTRQGYCLYIGAASPQSMGNIISKPLPHYSISGLYGGADNTDVALSHYYKGGSYVANNSSNTNVPTSGAIDFSDFRGQG